MARICNMFCLGLILLVAFLVVRFLYKVHFPGPPPQLDPEEWWGPTELKVKQDNSVRPFKVKFEESMIADLKRRLNNSRQFTKPLEGVAFEYGFNTDELKGWIKYWVEKYPFADRENFFNQYPQYKTSIQGLDIHFIRVKPTVPAGVEVVPILLVHGWPGSVREFYEAIPLLTQQRPGYDFVFEVIVPSLPGYGFSDPAVRPGLGGVQTAVIYRNLMHRLGLKKFYVQGGDWGSLVVSALATLYPEDVLGHHNNLAQVSHPYATIQTLIGAVFPSLVVESHLADRMYPLSSYIAYILEEFGYFHLQATKPDSVGVSLTDSPAGLLAYILEKFATWTRREHKLQKDGGLGYRFTKDQLIDNIMVYWSTNTITTSMRYYAENFSNKNRELSLDKYGTTVPTWALQAKEELFYHPPNFLRLRYKNLIGTTVLDEGGHFFAFELPKAYADDVFKAVKAFREWRKNNQKTEL